MFLRLVSFVFFVFVLAWSSVAFFGTGALFASFPPFRFLNAAAFTMKPTQAKCDPFVIMTVGRASRRSCRGTSLFSPRSNTLSAGGADDATFNATLRSWNISGRDPSFSEWSRGDMVGMDSRIMTGFQEQLDDTRKRKHEIELAAASSSPVPLTSAVGWSAVVAAQPVKMCMVGDQVNDLEIPELDAGSVARAHANHERLTGGGGPPGRTSSSPQTVLRALLRGSGPILRLYRMEERRRRGAFGRRIARMLGHRVIRRA